MTDQKQHDERKATPGQSEQPLNATNADLDTLSAQEQHLHDDRARAQQQGAEHANPNEPLPSDEQAGTVGKEGQEQGSEPPRGNTAKSDNQRNVQEAVRRTEEAIDSGTEAPA